MLFAKRFSFTTRQPQQRLVGEKSVAQVIEEVRICHSPHGIGCGRVKCGKPHLGTLEEQKNTMIFNVLH